jgi:nitroimidazol reductase NimA-like FMN-containing flavoprotein (pyridoxamine 5'-phosphate oxidase superfamily)
MRRSDKQVIETGGIEAILREGTVCFLALAGGNSPYVVPLNYGYADNVLYFHCAGEGMKIDLIRVNPSVSFSIVAGHEVREADRACNWGAAYRSVIGFGRATILSDLAGKEEALRIIMRHYSPEREWRFTEEQMNAVLAIRVDITSMTGKQSAMPAVSR